MVAKSRKVFWAEIGAKQPNYFSTDRTCTVLYGVLRYGTVNTVKKAEVRRISTSLNVFHRSRMFFAQKHHLHLLSLPSFILQVEHGNELTSLGV
jgi:hypothetical protein